MHSIRSHEVTKKGSTESSHCTLCGSFITPMQTRLLHVAVLNGATYVRQHVCAQINPKTIPQSVHAKTHIVYYYFAKRIRKRTRSIKLRELA